VPSKAEHQALLRKSRPFYFEMLERQLGVCAICGRAPSIKRKLDTDHDHKKMFIRGLLCHRCNRVIPPWMTAEWCYSAGEYLARGAFVLDDGSIITL
jgi:rRNA maturation endonuclease Nob1